MPRFYCPVSLSPGIAVVLPENVAHHLQVLRLVAGDRVTLFNGEGGTYAATLKTVERRQAVADVDAFSDAEAELPFAITLAQGLPEASKMDWIIEKAVELGAAAIQPLTVARCVVKLTPERAQKKHAHWQSIVISAAEQCGRNRLAQLSPPVDFAGWISRRRETPVLLLSPRATRSLSAWAREAPPQDVVIAIGPEGGFTAAEEQLAVAAGAQIVSMGPRVLRTETAGLAAIAALSAFWGGM